MKIIVLIKQVPGTSKVEIDGETGVLKRSGAEAKMNPYDLYAIETALRLKEKTGGSVTAVTMGPEQASAIIKEAYMMGADKGILVSDRRFAGSDVLATSRTLSEAVRLAGEFDIIICGRQTTDGDTAQVGPSVAENLGVPHITWVSEIKEVTDKSITVVQDLGEVVQSAKINLPCLISVEKGIYSPRLPSYKKKLATADLPVDIFTLDDFKEKDESLYGLKGSATVVERIFPPETACGQVYFEEDIAEKLYDTLKAGKYI